MWSLTPLFGVLAGCVLIMSLFMGSIWAPKATKPGERYTCPLVVGFRGILFAALAYYGLLFWDAVIKVGFLGILGYGNFSYQLAPLILMAILGSFFLVGSAFTAPTRASLVAFGAIVIYSMYYLQVEALTFMGEDDSKPIFYLPVLIDIVIVFIVEGVALLYRAIRKKRPIIEAKRLWDISTQFKRIASRRMYILLWVLFSVEFILEFEGLSLLYWLF
jgi:hypothetical protein